MVIASMFASMAAWLTPTVLFCVMNLIVGTIFIASKSSDTKHHDHVDENSFTPIARVSSFLERARSVNVSSYTTTATATVSAAAESSQHQIPSQSKTARYSSSSRLAQSIHFCYSHVTSPELSVGDEIPQSESERQTANQPVRSPSLLERVKSIKFPSVYSDNTLQLQTESGQISNSPGQLDRAPSFFDRVMSFKISSAFNSGAPFTENVDTITGRDLDHHVIKSKSEKSSAKKPVVEMKKSRSEMRIASDDEDDVDVRRPATARAGRSAVDEEVDAKADDFISRFKQQLKLQRLESLVRYRDMMNRGSWN